MKKALANTRVSVKLRKSEYREEWYLYVEAYPVFQADKPTPQRVREYLNRTITTPIWDKSRNARTDKDEQRKKIVDLFPLHPLGNALSLADRDHNQCDNRSYNSQNLDARHGFVEQHDRQGHGDQQRKFARNAGHTDAQFFRHIAVQVEINEGNAA